MVPDGIGLASYGRTPYVRLQVWREVSRPPLPPAVMPGTQQVFLPLDALPDVQRLLGAAAQRIPDAWGAPSAPGETVAGRGMPVSGDACIATDAGVAAERGPDGG